MKIDMRQFLESFFEETAEHIETMEGALLQLETTTDRTELLNTIFRSAHTIKGASSTFGVHAVAEFTHVLESLLEKVRDGHIEVTADLTELLLTSVDILNGLLSAARSGTPEPPGAVEVLEQLQKANEQNSEPAPSAAPVAPSGGPATYAIRFAPSREFFHFGLDPLLLLRDLKDCGTISHLKLDSSCLPPLEEMDPETCYLSWTLDLQSDKPKEDIESVFLFVDDESLVDIKPASPRNSNPEPSGKSDVADQDEGFGIFEDALPDSDVPYHTPDQTASAPAAVSKPTTQPKPASRTPAAAPARPTEDAETGPRSPVPQRESVRVDGERLDDMINQIGELVIGISMVEQEWASFHPGMESSAIGQLSKIVRELQERSLSLRMVPVAGTFQKMARVLRDLSRKLGKKVNFVTSGEETELDKTVVDRIGDPLLHMIRNAIDHGIERPDIRQAAGKPEEGTVTLSAFHKGGNIYIEIQDDGRGLNRDAIRKKAIERGVISEDDSLTDKELHNLIFAAGFSTATEVTDVSGRGVGMDVVRRNVESLQGHVSITSVEGEGSTVTVRLPLTLAILDGLTVALGEEVFVIPLLSVVESTRPSAKELKRVAGVGEVVLLRGEVVPLLRLHELLHIQPRITEPSEGLVVIVEEQSRKYAILVDELLGQQQVVIKNLETNFRKVPGVAGATILGDGRVAFILDINGLRQLAQGPIRENRAVAEEPA
ncbi:MAG: chemotaxis protein CheA [Planctomycetaceae bacterium]|nr:chemotaxis protein CheA [Planctomycetaceae bacterium]